MTPAGRHTWTRNAPWPPCRHYGARVTNDRLQRWQDRTDEWLLGAAAVFLVAYAIPIVHPSLPAWLERSCQVIVYVVWAAFVADLAARVWLSQRRGRYLLT